MSLYQCQYPDCCIWYCTIVLQDVTIMEKQVNVEQTPSGLAQSLTCNPFYQPDRPSCSLMPSPLWAIAPVMHLFQTQYHWPIFSPSACWLLLPQLSLLLAACLPGRKEGRSICSSATSLLVCPSASINIGLWPINGNANTQYCFLPLIQYNTITCF